MNQLVEFFDESLPPNLVIKESSNQKMHKDGWFDIRLKSEIPFKKGERIAYFHPEKMFMHLEAKYRSYKPIFDHIALKWYERTEKFITIRWSDQHAVLRNTRC